MSELEKYTEIYSSPKHASYGHVNNGAHALKLLIKAPPVSVVDIGCGWNEFCGKVKEAIPSARCVGVDFACPGADLKAEAHQLPFADKEFELLTSFDMLEHSVPELVDAVLAEMARVSKRFIFSISHVPSKRTWQGQNLHPTVQPEEWWMTRIMRAGGLHLAKCGRYITGTWGNPWILPATSSCVLVGNGPSALLRKRGAEIDSFDQVVRFNGYAIDPWADRLGSKTTLWSTYGRGKVPQGEQRPNRILYQHGEVGDGPAYTPEHLHLLPSWFYNRTRAEVQNRIFWAKGFSDDYKHLKPTSGLQVTAWLLQVVGLECVHLVGFDHFRKDSSKQHHYWDASPFGRPKDHDGDVEADIFNDLRRAGKVIYL